MVDFEKGEFGTRDRVLVKKAGVDPLSYGKFCGGTVLRDAAGH